MPATALIPTVAVAAACLIASVSIFQVALAAGAPWAAAAYGGRFVDDESQLPTRYRVSSAMAALALVGVAWLILVAGSVIGPGPGHESILTAAMLAAAALFAVNTLGNLSGKHTVERFGASTITAVLTVLCLVIAVGR